MQVTYISRASLVIRRALLRMLEEAIVRCAIKQYGFVVLLQLNLGRCISAGVNWVEEYPNQQRKPY